MAAMPPIALGSLKLLYLPSVDTEGRHNAVLRMLSVLDFLKAVFIKFMFKRQLLIFPKASPPCFKKNGTAYAF